MLRLQAATPDAWIGYALEHFDAILVDHAHCEQKAAHAALSFVPQLSNHPELLEKLIALSVEEIQHFQAVTTIIHQRGLKLIAPQKNPYINHLRSAARHEKGHHLVDRVIIAALIEARSCERLQLLATHLEDTSLRQFYTELWKSEAGHHSLFWTIARTLSKQLNAQGYAIDPQARLEVLSHHEAQWMQPRPHLPIMHG